MAEEANEPTSGRWRSAAVQNEAGFALGFGLVHGCNLLAVGFPFGATFLGRFDAADTAPALSGFGIDQAHLFLGMMRSAVVTKSCF